MGFYTILVVHNFVEQLVQEYLLFFLVCLQITLGNCLVLSISSSIDILHKLPKGYTTKMAEKETTLT